MARGAVVLVVDRLQAGLLGPYGAAWMRTPSLNRLAAESFTFDQLGADSPRLEDAYRAYWNGAPAMAPESAADASLPIRLAQLGVRCVLATDEPIVAELGKAAAFSQIVQLQEAAVTEAAASIEETTIARFFAAATEAMEKIVAAGPDTPFLLWLHTRGLGLPWDAPRELREQYADEEDPAPPNFVEPPEKLLGAQFDPDELLGVTHAYAGQVSLLDACLGVFMNQLAAAGLKQSVLLTLISPRGFPLGEHRRIGPADEALYEELIHAPWFIRWPDGAGAADRTDALVQPADLNATLCDWWQGAGSEAAEPTPIPNRFAGQSVLPIVRGQAATLRDRLCTLGQHGERSIRTPAWRLRRTPSPSESSEASAAGLSPPPRLELYAKPEDRLEVNEVSSRAADVTAALAASLDEFEAAWAAGNVAALPPLDEALAPPAE